MCHGVSGSSGLGMFTSCCGTESPCLLVGWNFLMEVEAGEDKKKSEVKSNLMNSSISGQGGFSWFVFATFFHFSPTWMPCPKHFAISPRIYCSFY